MAGLLPLNWSRHTAKNLVKIIPKGRRFFSEKSNFTEEQFAFALQQHDAGITVGGIARKLGVSEQTFYRWKKKFGGLAPSEVRRLKQLEDENKRLKQRVADLSLDRHMLQEVVRKKLSGRRG